MSGKSCVPVMYPSGVFSVSETVLEEGRACVNPPGLLSYRPM